MSDEFQAVDYLSAAAKYLAVESKLMDVKTTWPHLRDGLLPTLAADDKCECVMPTNIELDASPTSTAGQTKVKATGRVTFALAAVFQDRVEFLITSGTFKLKFTTTTVRYADVQEVNPVGFKHKMNAMDGFEILTTAGRLPVLGNDPYKYNNEILGRWNKRLMQRLTGKWVPQWEDGAPRTSGWVRAEQADG